MERAQVLREIQAAVGEKGWTSEPEELAPHLTEQRGLFVGNAVMLVRPKSTDEVAAVVRLCSENGIAIVPQGGNTGLVGGGVPFEDDDGIVLSLSRMNRIRSIDEINDTITVEAGCILADIQAAAADVDRLFPLSLGAEGSCQIGGNISTNAGGTAVLRYGNMRSLVLGLEVVLPDGQVWDGLTALRKDNTGYDLKQLFIGGEGTLGIVTAAVLRLFPRPRDVVTAFAALRDVDAVLDLFGMLRRHTGEAVTGLELMPRIALDMAFRHVPETADPFAEPHSYYALIELAGQRQDGSLRASLEEVLAEAHDEGLVPDATIAESLAQGESFWRLREAIVEAQKHEGGSIKHDVSVPVSKVPAFIREASDAVQRAMPGIRPIAFGHVGDGNVHFNLSQPEDWDKDAFIAEWGRMNRIVHDIVVAMGGSISAEHGIGRLKLGELIHYKDSVEIELMKRIKSAIDPKNIMNPGKLI
jgi:D-lactate dehydrogenase (cytochrome)